MTLRRTIPCLLLVLFLLETAPLATATHAERLPESDLGSNLPMNCDLCWTPSTNETDPNRLPTVKPRRPRRPPDSRPRRIPKGSYHLAPDKKPSSSLFLPHSQRRHDSGLISAHQITVIDGDTLRIGAERIRLRGIDAPELSEPNGWAATQRLRDLLGAGSIQLIPRGRDVYDRVVADVFVNGQNVAESLKREGLAKSR
jgi:endonuclease YncB( thermonuclease family)